MPRACNGEEPLRTWALVLGCIQESHREFKKEKKMHRSNPKDSDLMSGVQSKLGNFLNPPPKM